jgi:hypothetical protein
MQGNINHVISIKQQHNYNKNIATCQVTYSQRKKAAQLMQAAQILFPAL